MSDIGFADKNKKRFECDVCHRWFARNSSLTEHKYIHSNRYPFECEVCGKKFRQNSNLIAHHKRIHQKADASPHRCRECGREFAVLSYLRSHSLSHKQSKDNLCHKCGQTFKFQSDLVRHLKIHDNQRQYKCNVCHLGFNDRSALRRHTSRAHPTDKSAPKESSVGEEQRESGVTLSNLTDDEQRISSIAEYINVCRILPVPLPNPIFEKLIEMQRQIGLELGLSCGHSRRANFCELLVAVKDLNAIIWEHLKSIENRL